MALHSDTDLYRAVIDLQKYVARAVIDLRRDFKTIYGQRLVDESLWMCVVVRHASIARDANKVPHFEQLLDQLEVVQVILRLLLDLKCLPRSKFAESLPLTVSIGKQVISLRNHFAPEPPPVA